jgi:hypothetical protein
MQHPSPAWWIERDAQERRLDALDPDAQRALGPDRWARLRALDLQEGAGAPLPADRPRPDARPPRRQEPAQALSRRQGEQPDQGSGTAAARAPRA